MINKITPGDILRMKNFHHTENGMTFYFKSKAKGEVSLFMYLGTEPEERLFSKEQMKERLNTLGWVEDENLPPIDEQKVRQIFYGGPDNPKGK